MLKKYFCSILFVALGLITPAFSVSAQGETAKARNSKTMKSDEIDELEFAKGIRGDADALESSMQNASKRLADNPKDALALVWRGAGKLVLARNAFYKGDFAAGSAIFQNGLVEMAEAVDLAANDVRVLMVRGTTWLQASKQFPDPDEAKRLLQASVGDLEKILVLSENDFNKLPAERRDDILLGLAEGYERLGNKAKARSFYLRISNEATGVPRQTAVTWLQANPQ